MNQLEQLKRFTKVVADTGDFSAIEQYQPQDTTTNPSLLLKAAEQPEYSGLIESAIDLASHDLEKYELASNESDITDNRSSNHLVEAACDHLSVLIGAQLIERIPGRNSTEVDARLSFDSEKTVAKAKRLIDLYQRQGIAADRVLIKIAATWEGIKAAEQLEQQGIQCTLTLLFSMAQARACAEAGVYLISPFVGRILDWHKQKHGLSTVPVEQDPGVISVTDIYNYYKSREFSTIVMGASFRNSDEVLALAGCDRLTISPALLNELQQSEQPVQQKLFAEQTIVPRDKLLTEADFRWQLNQDAMATEKTAEGIRAFAADQVKLEHIISARLN